ncbi:hypothetical protein [Amycolatopsis sp. 195334CR]|uniref:hypothetical protein n=1 Tax=Amycolatopsis sp. 195334CR TaxID=2814588 RepID=UPI0027DABBE2|nr:hypothetical protein [Amycolatopsis sp. 195334CR]
MSDAETTEPETAAEPVAEKPDPHAEAVLKLASAMQRDMLVAGGAVVAVAVVAAAIWQGLPGLVSALVGGVIALLSAVGTILMMRKTAYLPPSFVLVVALGGYAVKLFVLFGVMFALRYVTYLHELSVGITMIAVILIAAVAEMRAFRRTKIPTIIPA